MEKKYKDFIVTKRISIEELSMTLVELIHEPSGAQVMHLQNDDIENVFTLSLKTVPSSSNGAPHILEHTVLCGSKKFPVRDPFFAMHRRSLNTYMNALTGADFTCYPAASLVKDDFYNLLDVYIDAVFHPKLEELSFLQEGHRLEFQEPQNPVSPLLFRGIVYNEMKGSLASADTRLWKQIIHELYPTLPYRFNSGGDPEEIPNLTYQELLDFHKTYYHPSRCLFYFYGNLPLESHLDFLSKTALKNVEKKSPLPPFPKEKRFKEPRFVTARYPISEEDEESELLDKNMISIGWLTCSIQEQKEWLALQVLDLILMGTDASPLKDALLKSGLCKQADTYIDCDATEIPVVLICKGCKEGADAAINALVTSTLKMVVKEGIKPDLIEAAIHQIEFSRSEITGSHSPFGLSLFMRSALLKQHGVNPEEGLKIHSLFESLRTCTKDPNYLISLLFRFLIDNPHKVVLTMKPDPHLVQEEKKAEEATLNKIRNSLSDAEIQDIIVKTNALKELQEKQDNSDILPKVTLESVCRNARELPLQWDQEGKMQIAWHECFTNKIVYADIHFDLSQISESELPYLRLFSGFLSEIGCADRDYKKNLEYIQEHTGGVGAFVSMHVQADDYNKFKPTFGIRGKALYRKADKLFSLLKEMMLSTHFTDMERLKDLLRQHHSSLEHHITQNALKYAINLSSKSFSLPAYIGNLVYGLDYLFSLREIVKEFDQNPNILIGHFQRLQEKLLAKQNGRLVISCDKGFMDTLKNERFYDIASTFTKKQENIFKLEWKSEASVSQGRIIASPVAFTAMSLPTVPYEHKDAAALNIAAHLFENKTLHKRIREQGGAYGAGASPHALAGHFTFYTYRDPHISNSLNAIHESIEAIRSGAFTGQDLEETKLQILQDLDSPIPPGQRASTAFSWLLSNKTEEVRNAYRRSLLDATKEQIVEAVDNHISQNLSLAILVSFANREFLENEAKLLKTAFPIFAV